MSAYRISKRIEIDAAHRIRSHGSKCRNLHGHRYGIEALCSAVSDVHSAGEQAGMVLDFGFLKEAMLRLIDAPCDHGLILEVHDEALLRLLAPPAEDVAAWLERVREQVAADGFCATREAALESKLYVIDAPPTAECLARHWFERLAPEVVRMSEGLARLERVRVWETPSSYADYQVESD